ncbi:MAG: hypothetical protein ACI308_09160 [Muribaculaceae bacterium]
MRKIFLALAMTVATTAFAQVLNVASIEKVNIKGTGANVVVGVSPKGDYLLLSGAQLNGLVKYDLTTQQAEVITEARGAGLNAAISDDGNSVIYREDRFEGGLRYSDLNVKDLASGATRQLASATRNLNAVSVQGSTAVLVSNGRSTKTAIKGTQVAKSVAPVASIVNKQLTLTEGSETRTLSPNGTQHSYIWPSVSPDGTKVCYYVCGVGCYVCDLKGNIVANLGKLRAAKWLNDTTIVAMDDADDGHTIVSSSIVAATLSGERQTLTGSDLKAMYPYTDANGKTIVFGTLEGETYMINLK